MMDRWPALMSRTTAAAYLDLSVREFERHPIPAVHLTPRGDKRYAREDLDAFIEMMRERPVEGRKA